MHFVLWFFLVSGTSSSLNGKTFDSREACEKSAADVERMQSVINRRALAKAGNTVFFLDHVCSAGGTYRE